VSRARLTAALYPTFLTLCDPPPPPTANTNHHPCPHHPHRCRVQVYDTNMHQFVGSIKRPRGGRFADCFDCQLYVHDGDTAKVLYVAWPDYIKVSEVAWASLVPSKGSKHQQQQQQAPTGGPRAGSDGGGLACTRA
jgi:hypothetical protein